MAMRFLLLSLCIFSLVGLSVCDSLSEPLEWIVGIKVNGDEDVQKLIKSGISLHGPKKGSKIVEAYVPTQELANLEALGLSYSMVPNDNLLQMHREKRSTGMQYHNYNQMTAFLQNITATFPSITKLFSIGKSKQNRELWALEISKNPGSNEAEPEFKYVANMHGDEVVGREMSLKFIELLCNSYGKDNRFTSLIDKTDIYIVPSMNPDGFELGTRGNANGRDINRDFPDQFTSPNKPTSNCQPEVQAVMEFTKSHHFILSANFHGGSVVANYPWDGNANYASGQYSASPDDAVFKQLSLTYSTNHKKMKYSTEFTNGITNGADWYVLYGGMQDWNYLYNGVFEITIELSDLKWPAANTLDGFWDDNREAMITYLELIHTMGVRGTVTDARTQQPVSAKITVQNINLNSMHNDPQHGDYYRLLTPGTYTIQASATGYATASQTVVVHQGVQSVANFVLSPQ